MEHWGETSARHRYWREVLVYIRPAFIKRPSAAGWPAAYPIEDYSNPGNMAMLRNHFKVAFRNLMAGKSFSVINIAGLAVGMAGAVLILLWLQNEISFDKFHENKDRLYQVYGLTNNAAGPVVAIPTTSQPVGPTLEQTYPEVEAATRVKDTDSFLLRANGKSITGTPGAFVDPAFLHLFSFPLVAGVQNEQLRTVSSIVITEKLAKKLFGTENALHQIIQLDSVDRFIVTGVLKDLPSNTRFTFEYLLPWDYLKKLGEGWANESWLSNNTATFLLLKPNVQAAALSEKIRDLTWRYSGRRMSGLIFFFRWTSGIYTPNSKTANPWAGALKRSGYLV